MLKHFGLGNFSLNGRNNFERYRVACVSLMSQPEKEFPRSL